jgi:dolichol-phosphate mannosyltransferase
MSGFFAVRRDSIDLDHLRPRGFKILLEIVARSPRLKIGEQAFAFRPRYSGDSKASLSEGMTFVRQMLCLRVATLFGRQSQRIGAMAGFAAVGLSGMAVNSIAMALFVSVLGELIAG